MDVPLWYIAEIRGSPAVRFVETGGYRRSGLDSDFDVLEAVETSDDAARDGGPGRQQDGITN
jgi:hypothetical protein